MKYQKLIPFFIYLLTAVAFTFYYLLLTEKPAKPFAYDEKAAAVVTLFQAMGEAAREAGEDIGNWIRFITISLLMNSLYFVAFKFVIGLRIWEMVVAIIYTLILSFLAVAILHPILNWMFNEYYSVTLILLSMTFVVTRWVVVHSESHTT